MSNLIRSTFTFVNIKEWSHELNSWSNLFKIQHGFFPTIMLASSLTYSRIDMVVNATSKHKLTGSNGQKPMTEEFIRMTGFKGANYELSFCVKEALVTGTIQLLFDPGPGGGFELDEKAG